MNIHDVIGCIDIINYIINYGYSDKHVHRRPYLEEASSQRHLNSLVIITDSGRGRHPSDDVFDIR